MKHCEHSVSSQKRGWDELPHCWCLCRSFFQPLNTVGNCDVIIILSQCSLAHQVTNVWCSGAGHCETVDVQVDSTFSIGFFCQHRKAGCLECLLDVLVRHCLWMAFDMEEYSVFLIHSWVFGEMLTHAICCFNLFCCMS